MAPSRSSAVLLSSALLCLVARPAWAVGDTMRSIIRPDVNRESDLRKLEEQITSLKMKQQVEPDQPLPEPVASHLHSGEDAAQGEPTRGLPALGMVAAALKRARVPLLAAGAITAGRSLALQRINALLQDELTAIGTACGVSRVEPPTDLAGLRGRLQALADARERRSLLREHILPLRAQLDEGAAAHSLITLSLDSLAKLNGTLTARVLACGALLAEYEALGQPAPPGFRAWPLEQLRSRLDNMESKGELLRKIIALNTRLGGARLDWAMPDWSKERLEAHATSLTEQAEETRARKDKAAILGKVRLRVKVRAREAPHGRIAPTLTLAPTLALPLTLTLTLTLTGGGGALEARHGSAYGAGHSDHR